MRVSQRSWLGCFQHHPLAVYWCTLAITSCDSCCMFVMACCLYMVKGQMQLLMQACLNRYCCASVEFRAIHRPLYLWHKYSGFMSVTAAADMCIHALSSHQHVPRIKPAAYVAGGGAMHAPGAHACMQNKAGCQNMWCCRQYCC